MEVPLPFARYRTVGDLPTPDDGTFDAIAWLNDITLNGRHIRNWTDEERRAFAEFSTAFVLRWLFAGSGTENAKRKWPGCGLYRRQGRFSARGDASAERRRDAPTTMPLAGVLGRSAARAAATPHAGRLGCSLACHTRRVVPGQPLTRGSFLYDGRNVALQRCLTVRLAGQSLKAIRVGR
jgi:hypothetical protein